jgi:hypothetical protein
MAAEMQWRLQQSGERTFSVSSKAKYPRNNICFAGELNQYFCSSSGLFI